MTRDPKTKRLREEQQRLIRLARRSDFIKVEPLEVLDGYPPEKYLITYTCRGIKEIGDNGEPIPAEFHQMVMNLVDFPSREPVLQWQTPIWHPNIEHDGLRKVCTDNPKSWFPTKRLDFLVIGIGMMVQYQRYHAEWTAPYPIDKAAAEWVLHYAEPHSIIGPDKPFDDRPLLRRMPFAPAEEASPSKGGTPAEAPKIKRIVFGVPEPLPPVTPPVRSKRVVFGDPFSDH